MAAHPFLLRPCSTHNTPPSKPLTLEEDAALEDEEDEDAEVSSSAPMSGPNQSDVTTALDRKGKRSVVVDGEGLKDVGKSKGAIFKRKTRQKDGCSSSSSSVPPSSYFSSRRQPQQRGVHCRRRRWRGSVLTRGGRSGCCEDDGDGDDDGLQELALPLGMSFAAVIAQVLERKNIASERIPADHLSTICISAVKEAVANVYGKRFEYFLRNFEKSFGSTLQTLRIINEGNIVEQEYMSNPSYINNHLGSHSSEGAHESLGPAEEIQESQSLNQEDNQLVLLNGPMNQQLAHISQSRSGPGFNQAILSTFERSITEQARSNDLKEVEIGLTLRHLQLKQSQLDLNFYSNVLEKIKISMGFSKAHFKEEKLKNQMQDLRHAELLRRCIDFLVAGLLIMSAFLVYGAWVYSYKRITEATASCTPSLQEPKSWWLPKMPSFNSAWFTLRCHVVVVTRMSFGLLMILTIAYTLLQRSASSGPMMPVTFILLILGFLCGIAGKFCIDTLGGSGYWWLLHWEALCLLHFFANAFPSVIYYHLYGPVTTGLQRDRGAILPYWVRRSVFYSIMLLVLPMLSGLIPFASFGDWIEHLTILQSEML